MWQTVTIDFFSAQDNDLFSASSVLSIDLADVVDHFRFPFNDCKVQMPVQSFVKMNFHV